MQRGPEGHWVRFRASGDAVVAVGGRGGRLIKRKRRWRGGKEEEEEEVGGEGDGGEDESDRDCSLFFFQTYYGFFRAL